MRKVIIIVIGLIIVAAGVMVFNVMANSKEQPTPKSFDKVNTVFTEKVKLSSVSVLVEASGVVEAVERLELYSEVQGLMLSDGGKFKEGRSFRKGEVLVAVRANDIQASLVAKRSSFEKLLTSVMADLRLDYNSDFQMWSDYLKTLDVNKTIKELPAASSEQLKLFLTGRSIYSEYYNIKNSEINLSKYSVRAPYNGILVESNVDPGTVIRPGQKLGVFIRPNNYELEVAVTSEVADKLEKGMKASLSKDKYFDKTWEGEISRVNRTVNSASQLASVFVKTNSEELKDGMFMHTRITSHAIENAIEINRSMLYKDDMVFLVKDSVLMDKEIKIKHMSKNTAVITGINDGDQLLTKIPPGAFSGMKVSIYENPESK